jgi:hypothetical protein
MAVYVCQLLCPERHCVMGSVYEDSSDPRDDIRDISENMVRAKMTEFKLKWECGICDSKELRFEHGRTRFKTMDEAAPFMLEQQERNIESRKLIDFMKSEGLGHRIKDLVNNEPIPDDLQTKIVEIMERKGTDIDVTKLWRR